MRHQMHLDPKYREMIKSGTKKIELRLYDAKRKSINLGDEIEFLPMSGAVDPHDKLITKVVGILRYPTFKEIIADYPIEILAEENYSPDILLKDLEKLYTPGLQNTYGVVGFRLERI
ncbi:ASCH domain-containing protein [Candidatus Saccharibacteria bacterium]|nr:ASCH domain-containing protein [Candidatus Saccharibacteria bacterium]